MTNAQTPSASAPDEGEMESMYGVSDRNLKQCIDELCSLVSGENKVHVMERRQWFELVSSLQSRLKQAEAERDSYRGDADILYSIVDEAKEWVNINENEQENPDGIGTRHCCHTSDYKPHDANCFIMRSLSSLSSHYPSS